MSFGPPVYLDLFDDGIPHEAVNLMVAGGAFENRLLDTLRFQILLAMVFGRPVVVPEAWAVSSPAFVRVAGEILAEMPATVLRRDATGRYARGAPDSPFVLGFGTQAGGQTAAQRMVASLRQRLQGRRLMLHPSLRRPEDEQGLALRRRLGERLAGLPGLVGGDIVGFAPDAIAASLVDSGTAAAEAEVYRAAFATLLRHFDGPGRHGSQALDMARYHQRLAGAVAGVDAAVARLRRRPAEAQLLRHVGAFFDRIRAERLDLAQIMTLWGTLDRMDIPRADKAVLEAFGRYVLNRAYAAALGASDSSAISFDAYARDGTGAKHRLIADELMQRERADAPARTGAQDFVELARSQRYDLAHTIPWAATWRRAAEFTMSEGWRTQRRRLLTRLGRLAPGDRLRPEPWMPLFDVVNAELHHHLGILPQGLGFQLVTWGHRAYEVYDKAGKALELFEPTTRVPRVASELAVDAVVGLVQMLPRRHRALALLKAERALQRPGRLMLARLQ